MTLKSLIQSDLDEVFFDADELAEELDWEGTAVLAIPSSSLQDDRGLSNAEEHGVLTQNRAYHVRTSELPWVPVPWEELVIDGETWVVREIEERSGAYKIQLFRQQA